MVKQSALSKGSRSGAVGAGVGLAAAILLSTVLTVALTSLIVKGTVGEWAVGAFVFFVRLLSVLTGGLIGTAIAKEKYLKIIGIIIAGYLFVALGLGIAFYDGAFQNLGLGVVSVLLGGFLAMLVKLKPQRKGNNAKRYLK